MSDTGPMVLCFFAFSGPIGLLDYLTSESRKPMLVVMRDVAFSSISQEQNQSNRVFCFQNLDAVFLNNHVFRLFRNHNSCPCAVWQPSKVSPYIDISNRVCCFTILLVHCMPVGIPITETSPYSFGNFC